MRFIVIFGFLAFLLATASAKSDDANMGFDDETSGDGDGNPEFPTDDEDIATEGSANGTDANVVVDEDSTDPYDEPEVNGEPVDTGRDKDSAPKDLPPTNRIKEPDEEKDVDQNLGDEVDGSGAASSAGTQFLAAVVVGGCIGLLFAICVIMLLVYRMRKRDEGSYALEYGLDGKKPQGNYEYTKGVDSKEYFA